MPHPSITAETYPHKPAFIMGSSGEMVTYRQLDDVLIRRHSYFAHSA